MRLPLRCVSRSSGARSPPPAPISPDSSASISCCDPRERLAQEIEALALEQVADDRPRSSSLFVSTIVVTPLVVLAHSTRA
jgi:hypothetical protein